MNYHERRAIVEREDARTAERDHRAMTAFRRHQRWVAEHPIQAEIQFWAPTVCIVVMILALSLSAI